MLHLNAVSLTDNNAPAVAMQWVSRMSIQNNDVILMLSYGMDMTDCVERCDVITELTVRCDVILYPTSGNNDGRVYH